MGIQLEMIKRDCGYGGILVFKVETETPCSIYLGYLKCR